MERKQRLGVILSTIGVCLILFGTTMAFFNYTRTGISNTVRVGKISFESEQTNTISLIDVFPIDQTEVGTSTHVGTGTITITGDTTYSDGVEYQLTVSNLTNTIGTKEIPIDLVITANGIGDSEDDYFTERGGDSSIYKVITNGTIRNNKQLLVGYIASGATGIDGTVTIKAYIDKNKIAISDTYDGSESNNMGTTNEWVGDRVVLTTEEWNNLQANGVSFQVKVEANEGIWVEEPLTSYTQITRNVITPTNPINFANAASSSNGQGLYILPGTENDTNPIYYYRGAVTDNNVIFGDYCWQMVRTTDTGGIKMIYNGAVTGNGETCENTAHVDRIISSSEFNLQYNTVADVGYMKNARYTYTNGAGATGSIYGKDIEWDGTNYLVIEDTANTASANETKDNNHHYSCGTAGTTSCASVRYYYYNNNYITLTNGEKVEDALYKMTGNGDAVTKARNTGYVLNQNDSTIKTAIESWFRTNLTNEVDSTKRNYVSYLEDTIYCNDRSFKTTTGNISNPTYLESGWNPNGGDLTKYLYFGTFNRFNNNWYSTSNVPSVACPNETDRFSVSSGVAHLNYPVGLLSGDEAILAGIGGNGANNLSNYLYTGNYYWSLSPSSFYYNGAGGFVVGIDLSDRYVSYSIDLRPVVSLKPGTEFERGGEGTVAKPYVVKYN